MSDSGEDKLIGLGILLVLLPFMMVAGAWSFEYGWNSIAVPALGVAAINAYQAYGITMLAYYLTYRGPDNTVQESKGIWGTVGQLVGVGFGRPAFFAFGVWVLLWLAGPFINGG